MKAKVKQRSSSTHSAALLLSQQTPVQGVVLTGFDGPFGWSGHFGDDRKIFPCQEWNPESSILYSSLYTNWTVLADIKTKRKRKEQSTQHLCTTFALLCHDLPECRVKQILFSPSTQALICTVYS